MIDRNIVKSNSQFDAFFM